jgi:hypothetical protein
MSGTTQRAVARANWSVHILNECPRRATSYWRAALIEPLERHPVAQQNAMELREQFRSSGTIALTQSPC